MFFWWKWIDILITSEFADRMLSDVMIVCSRVDFVIWCLRECLELLPMLFSFEKDVWMETF